MNTQTSCAPVEVLLFIIESYPSVTKERETTRLCRQFAASLEATVLPNCLEYEGPTVTVLKIKLLPRPNVECVLKYFIYHL